MTVLNHIAAAAFLAMIVALPIWAISYRLHKTTSEFAFLVMSAALGILILYLVCSVYLKGSIDPVPAGKLIKRSIVREHEPILFYAILVSVAAIGLFLSAIVPIGLWRIVQQLRSRLRRNKHLHAATKR